MTPADSPAAAAVLRERARELGLLVNAQMYADPFWLDRFGERGKARAEEDAAFHVTYLAESMAAGDLEIMRKYARWLQTVLATRGMCTLHLDEAFRRLVPAVSAALEGAPRAQIHAAHAVLGAARAALFYEPGPARTLQEASPALAARTQEALGWDGSVSTSDAAHYLSYAADALALGRPELYRQHVAFAEDFRRRRGEGPLAPMLDLLRDALEAHGLA